MTSQKEIFSQSEADAYFARNHAKYTQSEAAAPLLVRHLRQAGIVPGKVLEIGCSNGLHLSEIIDSCGGEGHGLDPSHLAIADGKERFPHLALRTGTAERLDYPDGCFDSIIFGFCLYLCDRTDLFRIACEADRCLRTGGHLVIKDFLPPIPYANRYAHAPGVMAYKMDYSAMFAWNPAYVETARFMYSHDDETVAPAHPDERLATIILRKLPSEAYPLAPFSRP